MTCRLRRTPWLTLGLLVFSSIIGPDAARPASAEEVTVAEPAVRYPFDPVCPWGRIADGRGMLVRCLEASDVQRLAALVRAPASSPPLAPPSLSAATPSPSEARPARAVTTPVTSPVTLPPPPPLPGRPPRRVHLEAVSAARADTGDLPEARVQLLRASDRYVQCVESNGGLSSSPARVTLRFLVRERGRAEGVTVKERAGLSTGAAKCIASVIDRRYVGYPAAPIVGADLSVDFAWEGVGR
jgi:hypothetical protein